MIKVVKLVTSSMDYNSGFTVVMHVNNKEVILRGRVMIRKNEILISRSSYTSLSVLEKALSKFRGFITDKRNYKVFEKMINRNEVEHGISGNKAIVIKHFENVIKLSMGILENTFEEEHEKVLINLGYGQSERSSILSNNGYVINVTNE